MLFMRFSFICSHVFADIQNRSNRNSREKYSKSRSDFFPTDQCSISSQSAILWSALVHVHGSLGQPDVPFLGQVAIGCDSACRNGLKSSCTVRTCRALVSLTTCHCEHKVWPRCTDRGRSRLQCGWRRWAGTKEHIISIYTYLLCIIKSMCLIWELCSVHFN